MPRLPIYAKKYAMSDFGKYLKFCRDLNGVKQAELAEKLGVPYMAVETDYSQSDKGQLSTRLAAFLETIDR